MFTRESYERQYSKDSTLIETMKNEIRNKSLLFLGSSLLNDRFLGVMKREQMLKPGLVHYAIVNGIGDIDNRARELGEDYGIRTIFYPDGQHEAVRIILEKLLDDTNHEAFVHLSKHLSIPDCKTHKNGFEYHQNNTRFVGRTNEIIQLNELLSDPTSRLKWWAITGDGGSGKSRLASEFQKQISSDWDIITITSINKNERLTSSNQLKRDPLCILH